MIFQKTFKLRNWIIDPFKKVNGQRSCGWKAFVLQYTMHVYQNDILCMAYCSTKTACKENHKPSLWKGCSLIHGRSNLIRWFAVNSWLVNR